MPVSVEIKRPGIDKTEKPIEGLHGDTVTSKDDDAGYHHLAKAIAGIIRNPEIELPFNVGIIGEYGCGKTKILEQLKEALKATDKETQKTEESEPKIDDSPLKKINVKIVEFDVGRFHESHIIWSALIYSFFDEFKKEKGFFCFGNYFWTLGKWEKIKNGAIVFFAMVATGASIYVNYQPFSSKAKILFDFFPTITFLVGIYFLWKKILSIWFHPTVAGSIEKITQMPLDLAKDFSNRVAFEEKLKRLITAWLKKDERIVLIIDNLDRCSLKNITSIIDELYALISTKKLKEKLECVIAVDQDAINKAIIQQRDVEAKDYFEKLFSLKIYPPKLNEHRLCEFLRETAGLEFNDGSARQPNEIDPIFNDYCIDNDEKMAIYQKIKDTNVVVNPRRVLRIVSSYRFLRYIWPRWFLNAPSNEPGFEPNKLIDAIVERLVQNIRSGENKYNEAVDLIAEKYDMKGKEETPQN